MSKKQMKPWAPAFLFILAFAFSAELAAGETYVVAIDVGHTKASPGAISASGRPEYEFNREIARQLEERLKETNKDGGATINPFIISSERSMALPSRTKIATSKNADLFVSIHHDSAQDQYLEERVVNGKEERFTNEFSGYSVFVSRKNPRYAESFDVAQRIGRAMQTNGFKFARHHHEQIAGENRPFADEAAGVYAFDDLVVLKTATMPAVLVECGVIVNPKEEEALQTKERQAAITSAIVRGIRDHFAHAPATPRAQKGGVTIETTSPAPTRYPKPGATLAPALSRDN
ncbi:MAG: N-acetylmuramoyl-L-alanine amidase [Verrucomicrobiota bacterium]|nr:N-acetylmuramoyl-L-alanine amidase [Verrucomicrobiota bacterium]